MKNQNTKFILFESPHSVLFTSAPHTLEMSLYIALAQAYIPLAIRNATEVEFYEKLEITNSEISPRDFISVLHFLGLNLTRKFKLEQFHSLCLLKEEREKIGRCFQILIYHQLIQERFKDPNEYQILRAAATLLKIRLKIYKKTLETQILPLQFSEERSKNYECIELFRSSYKFHLKELNEEEKFEQAGDNVKLTMNHQIYSKLWSWEAAESDEHSEWGSMVDRNLSTLATPRPQKQINLRASEGWDQSAIGQNRVALEMSKEQSKSRVSVSLVELCCEMDDSLQEESRDNILAYMKQYLVFDQKAALLAKSQKQFITFDTCKDTVALQGVHKLVAQKFDLTSAEDLFIIHNEEVESPRCPQCGQILHSEDLIQLFKQHIDPDRIRKLYSLHYTYRKNRVDGPHPLYLEKVMNHFIAHSKSLNLKEWMSKHQRLDKTLQKVYDLQMKIRALLPLKETFKKEKNALRRKLDKLGALARSTKLHNDQADISNLKETSIETLRLLVLLAQKETA